MELKINNKIKSALDYKTGLYLVFFTALVSGFSIFINSFGVKGFDSSVFTFSKNIIVAVFLFAVIAAFGNYKELMTLRLNQWKQLAIIGLIGGSIPFLLFFKGLQMANSATSGFIQKLLFVFVAVFAVLFLKEKLNKKFIAGALLLMAGTYFMIRPDFVFSAWQLLILVATIFWAAETVYSKHVLKSQKLSGNIVAFGRMFFGSIFIFIFLAFTGKAGIVLGMNLSQYFWILITAGLLFAYVVLYYNGLKLVNASTAASILVIAAPITTILSWMFGSATGSASTVTLFDALGVISILAGVILVVLYAKNADASMLNNEARAEGAEHNGRH